MLDPKHVRSAPDAVAQQLLKKHYQLDVERLIALEERRKSLQVKTEQLQGERNSGSKEFGKIKAQGGDVAALKERMDQVNAELKANIVAVVIVVLSRSKNAAMRSGRSVIEREGSAGMSSA